MKINEKLIVTFFIVIGLLTEINGAEKNECYIDLDKERVRQIESQISSLQIEMDQIKQHQSQSINSHASNTEMETNDNSIPLYMNKQDPVQNINCKRIAFYTCTALTTGLVALGGYLYYVDYQFRHMGDNLPYGWPFNG